MVQEIVNSYCYELDFLDISLMLFLNNAKSLYSKLKAILNFI